MTLVRRAKHVTQGAAAVAVTAVLAATAVTNHAALAASVAMLGHLRWIWIPSVIVLESTSMAALAGMQRRLLAAGGARMRIRSMLATTLAANALSVSVPLAGPELGTAFAFRRFTGQGADAPLAVWSLVVAGVASAAAGALLIVVGGLSTGNIPVMAATVATGLLGAAVFAAAVAAARRPRMRGALESAAAWMLRQGARLLHRPAGQPSGVIRSWAGRLGSLRLSLSACITVAALALINWLADAAVFAVSIQAVGAAIPWHVLLLAYGSGVGVQTFNVTPGGFGITEGTLGLTLVAAGLRAGQALAAVLLYRLVSFWLIASAGWLIFLWLRRHRRPPAAPGRPRRHPASMPGCHQGGSAI
jgi:putative heme transporter